MNIVFKQEDYKFLGKEKVASLIKHALPSERFSGHLTMDRDLFYKISNKPIYPSFLKQVGNFFMSGYYIVKYLLKSKGIFIEKLVYRKRLAICKKCIYFDKVNYRCGRCGCFAVVKNIFRSQKCPLGNW